MVTGHVRCVVPGLCHAMARTTCTTRSTKPTSLAPVDDGVRLRRNRLVAFGVVYGGRSWSRCGRRVAATSTAARSVAEVLPVVVVARIFVSEIKMSLA